MKILGLLFPADRWNRVVFTLFLVLWTISCIRVPYPKYFWLQHVPTLAAVALVLSFQNRLHLSRVSYTLVFAFMSLHVLGARYLYSYVPYDDWLRPLLGYQVTDQFGFTRNHYDRFVHLAFGLLLVTPAWRLSRRQGSAPDWWHSIVAFCVIMGASGVYEVLEWLVAMLMAPEWAESYNGQQGDPWDAQRDMALAGLGAILGVAMIAGWQARLAFSKTESAS
jgi:putative membrane protein